MDKEGHLSYRYVGVLVNSKENAYCDCERSHFTEFLNYAAARPEGDWR